MVFLPDNPMTRSVDVYEYAYSIRFTLLPEEEQLRLAPSARPIASAQLLSRHWLILDELDACTNTIEGEAVVGKYPHLTHGESPPLSVRFRHLCLTQCVIRDAYAQISTMQRFVAIRPSLRVSRMLRSEPEV